MILVVRMLFSILLLLGSVFAVFKMVEAWNFRNESHGSGVFPEKSGTQGELGSAGKPIWFKGSLVVPANLWRVQSVQKNLHEGDTYFLIEDVEPNRSCLLGRFRLLHLSEEKLVFSVETGKLKSKLEQFALTRRVPLRVSVVTGAQLSEFSLLNLCHEWFHAENL